MSALHFVAEPTARFSQVSSRVIRCGLPLLGLLLAGLNGCSREHHDGDKFLQETMHPIEIKQLDTHADPLTAGPQHPLNYDPPKSTLPGAASWAGPSTDATENATGAHYYVDFCDIYWKLNWMRKALLGGSVPYNMQDEIEKMFKKLKNLRHDGNYTVAYEALARMQKGLEHLACLRTMHAAQINDLEVPWEAGTAAVQQYFDRNPTEADAEVSLNLPTHTHAIGDDDDDNVAIGHPLPSATDLAPNTAASAARNQAKSMVLDYVTRYRFSPRTLMQREWEAAIHKTNRLRDNLALRNREQNNDGDSTNVDLAVTIGAGDYGNIHVPENAGQGSGAPAEVDYTKFGGAPLLMR
jgi:hypothetical protein